MLKHQDWSEALAEAKLNVLRIEFTDGLQPKALGMHPPHNLGQYDENWRQITNLIIESQALNIVLTLPEVKIQKHLDRIWGSWREMRKTNGFAGFYGNHQKEPFVKSGGLTDLVPREKRPMGFTYSARVGFMHRHEYVATLAYGYIDENYHQSRAAKRVAEGYLAARLMERNQILSACHEMWSKNRAMEHIWDFLLMQRASELPDVDFYGTLNPNYDFTSLLSTGNGKDILGLSYCGPLVESAQLDNGLPHRFLALAATKEQADKFAADLRKYLSDNVHLLDKKDVLVIRELNEATRQLQDDVVQSADVLVAIPDAACHEYLRHIFKPTHIVVDQANRISEPRLSPLMAWYTHASNEQFKAMVLIGDQKQLSPTVNADVPAFA
ncbi:uncharacterized protein N7483_012570 [Penicillium malachiteum]|uniref:uncharacterized protein n=1 Tax=Penicillium malachiteum TaxID=1324776 RepID=UPI0025467FCD|nr:uncharacterized protein N7483_012570 [Penicillium malachiteum]KAJ5715389.1 hypothetical protein N7483_012570 [Penicillium malachiteum]